MEVYFAGIKCHERFSSMIELPTTIEELEIVLKVIDSLQRCAGWPSTAKYLNVSSRVLFKDGNTWRHINCQIIARNKVCLVCMKNEDLLSSTINRRNRKIVKQIMATKKKGKS